MSNASFQEESSLPEATFEVVQVLKGEEHLEGATTIKSVYFGSGPLGKQFLLLALDAPALEWSRPIEVSDRARDYLSLVMDLPQDDTKRLHRC